jgi:acetylornithine deacetylase/succinyl-diaminopimelate desuccinylase-like protein
MASRAGAIERAEDYFDNGEFIEELARWVAIPTQSQLPDHLPELYRYLREEIAPFFERIGFDHEIFDNPADGKGPILVAQHIEDPARPTILSYGHGDVVTAFKDEWRDDLDPWVLTEDGDKLYGRGVVDNKGQHLIAMRAVEKVMAERGGELGFNAKFIIETGEEQGSHGLEDFIKAHTDLLACDVFFNIDGPRHSKDRPELSLGNRGATYLDVEVDLDRKGGLHSGHWGGVLPDAGIILTQALSTVTTPKGRILIDDWLPKTISNSVRAAARDLVADPLETIPEPDPEWGDTTMGPREKSMTTTGFIILAFSCGNPDNPVNAVPSTAKARCQIRHTVDVPRAAFRPALEKHLKAQGFPNVTVTEVGGDLFPATRTEPDDPWVQWCIRSVRETTGKPVNVAPSSGGSSPRGWFSGHLACPAVAIPHSYFGCGQHGPDEHGLKSLFREGIAFMTGLYWDAGEDGTPAVVRGG